MNTILISAISFLCGVIVSYVLDPLGKWKSKN